MKALEILKELKQLYRLCAETESKEAEEELLKVDEAIAEIEALQKKETCATCKKKLLCKVADRAKLEFGTKLYEMWFSCHVKRK